MYSPSTHPPLGLLYIGAVLENEGYIVEVIDYYAEDFSNELLEKSVISSDVVGMTVYTNDLNISFDISKKIKKINPKIPLIIGGPHCTFLKERSLLDLPHADISVMGEGEEVILDIVRYLNGDKNISDIHGIIYRNNGKIVCGKPLKIIDDINSLPFPARHLVQKYDYNSSAFGYKTKKKLTTIMTSRGCPFKCRFCARYGNIISKWGYRKRSAENVFNEIQEIYDKYGTIAIVDDNFLENKKRVHKFFDLILESKINVDFIIEGARVDTADKKLYTKMKKANVKLITFGIESGNQDVLNFYNKKITLEQIEKAVKLAREMNFLTGATFILGAPIETHKHIKNTIKFACSLQLDAAMFGPLMYQRGSSLWEEAVKNKKISKDEYVVFGDIQLGLGNFTRQEINFYTKLAHIKFYLRPKYIFSQIYKSILRMDYSPLINSLKFLSLLKNIEK